MAALSSSFFPPSNRRRCVKARPSYAENSDNFMPNIPASKDESNDNFNESDLVSVDHEQDDADEEPITIDLSAFLSENPLLAQAAFESSVENNATSTESSSQFRVTDCEVKPSELPVAEIQKPDLDDALNSVKVDVETGSPSLFLANSLVSDSHDSAKENCLSPQPDVTTISVPIESPMKMTINRTSPLKKFSRAKPLGLSNPLRKYKNFMKIKDFNKTNLNVFGKYPVVKCEKLDIDTLVKSSKIKISNWPPHPVKNSFKKTYLPKNVGPKRSILTKGPAKPRVKKSISFSKYLINPLGKSSPTKLQGLFKDNFESMLNPVVIKTDSWKPEISKISTMPKLFKSPIKCHSIISRPTTGGILNHESVNDHLTKNIQVSKMPFPRQPSKKTGPIITCVQKVSNSPNTFKLIAPKPLGYAAESKSVMPNLHKPDIEATSVSDDYTVIEPYVDDPTSPVKPKPILSVPIEVISSPEKPAVSRNRVVVNFSDRRDSPRTLGSVFLSRSTKILRESAKPRKIITVDKRQLFKKQLSSQKWGKIDKFEAFDPSVIQPILPDDVPVIQAKNAVVDAMQSAFKACNKTKRSKPKLQKKESLTPLSSVNTNSVNYSKTFNDLFFGFSDNDFEEVSLSTEDELSSQASIPSNHEDSPVSFKMPPPEAETEALKAVSVIRSKKSGMRKKFSTDSPYTSDTLSASECENEPYSKQKYASKAKIKRITSTPKNVLSPVSTGSLPAPRQISRTSSISSAEDISISSHLSDDVNFSQNIKTNDNNLPDSSSLPSLEQSDENLNITPSSQKIGVNEPSLVDIEDSPCNIDVETVHNDVKLKGNDYSAKQETCTRTLRHRKCSSVEVDKSFDSSTKSCLQHQDSDKTCKPLRGSIKSKLKIQMKTPPRSTAKVKIKQKSSKPDDILQEINTITGGKLKIQKGPKIQKIFAGKESNKAEMNKSSDLSTDSSELPISSFKCVSLPSQTLSKKKKAIKVSLKCSKGERSSFKLSPKSESDAIEKSKSESYLSENNESPHSSFRNKMAGKSNSDSEENNEADLDIDVENIVLETTVHKLEEDSQVHSGKTSIDKSNVNSKNSDSETEKVSQVLVENDTELVSTCKSDETCSKGTNVQNLIACNGDIALDNKTLENKKNESDGESDINNVDFAHERKGVESESSVEIGYPPVTSTETSKNERLYKENEEDKKAVNVNGTSNIKEDEIASISNTDLLISENNTESCDTVIGNESTLTHITKTLKSTSNEKSDQNTSSSVKSNKSLIVSSIYDESSTSCDSNNTEISPVEGDREALKPLNENDEASVLSTNVFTKCRELAEVRPVVSELVDLCEETTESEDVALSALKAASNENDQEITMHADGDKNFQETSKDVMDSELPEQVTPKKSLKLKISFQNSKLDSPDKNWVVLNTNPPDGADSKEGEDQDSVPEQESSSTAETSASNLNDADAAKDKDAKNSSSVECVKIIDPIKIKEEPVDISDDHGLPVNPVQSNSEGPKSKKRQRRRSSKCNSEQPEKRLKEAEDVSSSAQELVIPKTEVVEREKELTGDSTPKAASKPKAIKTRKSFAIKSEPNNITPKLKGAKKSISTPASGSKSTPQRKKNYDSKLVLVPFTIGWMREHVIRATSEKRTSDVYYFAPDGTKLRSMPDILTYLSKHPEIKLGREHFTFAKELIFREPFERERSALMKFAASTPGKRQSASLGGSNKKRSSIQGKNSLSLTAKSQDSPIPSTLSPIKKKRSCGPNSSIKKEILSDDESKSSPSTSTKQSTLDPYLVKQVGKKNVLPSKVTDGDKKKPSKVLKTAPSKGSLDVPVKKAKRGRPSMQSTSASKSLLNVSASTSSSSDSSNDANKEKAPKKSPTKKGKTAPDNSVSSSNSPTPGSERTKKIQKGLKVKLSGRFGKYQPCLQRPCTRFCNFSYLRIPSVQCSICLCLFHPECIPHARLSPIYACNPCAANQSIFAQGEDPDNIPVPPDIDLNLLQAESSIQIYCDPTFDEAFNKFLYPICHSFSYSLSPPVPGISYPNAHHYTPPVTQTLSSTIVDRVNLSHPVSRMPRQLPPLMPKPVGYSELSSNAYLGAPISTAPMPRNNVSSVLPSASKQPGSACKPGEGSSYGHPVGMRVLKLTPVQMKQLAACKKNSGPAQGNPSVLQTLLQSENSSGSSSQKCDSPKSDGLLRKHPVLVNYSKKYRLPTGALPNAHTPLLSGSDSPKNFRNLEIRIGDKRQIVSIPGPCAAIPPVTCQDSLVLPGPLTNAINTSSSGSTSTVATFTNELIDGENSANVITAEKVRDKNPDPQKQDPEKVSSSEPTISDASSSSATGTDKDIVGSSPSMKEAEKLSSMDRCMNSVFKYLNICDLLRASQVCQYWRKMAAQKYLWQHVRFSNLSVTDWIKCFKTLQKYQTRSIDLRGILNQDTVESWTVFSHNLMLLNKVQALIFEKVPPCVVKRIAEDMTHLKSLTCYCLTTVFTEPEIWSTPCMLELHSLVSFSQLQKLKISSMGGITLDDNYLSLLPYLPQLTHLVLTGFKFYTYVNLLCLAQLTQLVSLELGDCSDIEPQLYNLLIELKDLKNLCLQNGGKLDDFKIAYAISKLPKLENLELMNYQVSKHLSNALKNKDSLSFLSVWPDNSSQAAIVNFNALSAVTACTKLKGVCWGILTDSDDDVPNVLELRDPSKSEKDSYSMTFEELFQKLTSHFPGKIVELKCLPRTIWSEFCSSRDFL